jgi:CRP-like cAMP-binding protein
MMLLRQLMLWLAAPTTMQPEAVLNGLTNLMDVPFAADDSHIQHAVIQQDGDGTACRNRLLAALTSKAWQRIAPHLHHMPLVPGEILQASGPLIKQVYFVEKGLVSLVTDDEDGSQIEVAVTGNDGLVGALSCLGHHPALHKAMVQIPGTAYRLPVQIFEDECERNPQWRQLMLHYVNLLLAQSSRSALCNRTHTVEERLSRWLLIVRDRTENDRLALREELVAHMLGVRRSSVIVALSILQQAGLIDNTRRGIFILDNQKLECVACSCYGHIRNQFHRFESPVML